MLPGPWEGLCAATGPRAVEHGAGVARSFAKTLAEAVRCGVRALAARYGRVRLTARPMGHHRVRDDWQAAAEEELLDRAVDASDLERRQRRWERDESNAYSMSGWS